MRLVVRWVVGVIGRLAACGCVLLVAGWVLSRVVTDRLGWSQYVWWVPTAVWVVAAVVLLGVWWGVGRISTRNSTLRSESANGQRPAANGRKRGGWARVVVGGVICFMVARAVVFEWRAYRFVGPAREDARGLRIANWNPAVPVDSVVSVARANADVYVIANEPGRASIEELEAKLGEGWERIRTDRLTVLSSRRIVRWGSTRLGLAGRVVRKYQLMELDVQMAERVDEGRAMFVEIAAPEFGDEPLVLWVIDLPSDPRLLRREVMETARAVLADWEGRVIRFDESGEQIVERMRGGFPEADVVMGDFNTPRGSWSVSQLLPGYSNAFDVAGRGLGGTFPRRLALSQIDLMFVGEGVEVVGYELMDPGVGWHWMQVGEVGGVRR